MAIVVPLFSVRSSTTSKNSAQSFPSSTRKHRSRTNVATRIRKPVGAGACRVYSAYISSIFAEWILHATERLSFRVGVNSSVSTLKSRERMRNFWIFEALLGHAADLFALMMASSTYLYHTGSFMAAETVVTAGLTA